MCVFLCTRLCFTTANLGRMLTSREYPTPFFQFHVFFIYSASRGDSISVSLPPITL